MLTWVDVRQTGREAYRELEQKMNHTLIVIAAFAAISTGCRSPREPNLTVPEKEPPWMRDRWSGVDEPTNAKLTGLTGRDFPLPRTTPFDATPELRQEYVRAYCRGVQWQLFARGTDNHLGEQEGTPAGDAWNRGFKNGSAAAFRRISEKIMEGFQQ